MSAAINKEEKGIQGLLKSYSKACSSFANFSKDFQRLDYDLHQIYSSSQNSQVNPSDHPMFSPPVVNCPKEKMPNPTPKNFYTRSCYVIQEYQEEGNVDREGRDGLFDFNTESYAAEDESDDVWYLARKTEPYKTNQNIGLGLYPENLEYNMNQILSIDDFLEARDREEKNEAEPNNQCCDFCKFEDLNAFKGVIKVDKVPVKPNQALFEEDRNRWESNKLKTQVKSVREIKNLLKDEETEKASRKIIWDQNLAEKQGKKLDLSFETKDNCFKGNKIFAQAEDVSSISLKEEYESMGSDQSLYHKFGCKSQRGNSAQSKNNPRGPYNHYNTMTKKQALDMVREKKDVRFVAKYFQMPLNTLKRWMNRGIHRKKGGGRKVQDPLMEEKLAEWCKEQINTRVGLSSSQIKQKAYELSNYKGIFKASKCWLKNFMKRINYK